MFLIHCSKVILLVGTWICWSLSFNLFHGKSPLNSPPFRRICLFGTFSKHPQASKSKLLEASGKKMKHRITWGWGKWPNKNQPTNLPLKSKGTSPRWWFQKSFLFVPRSLGKWSYLTCAYVSDGSVQPPTTIGPQNHEKSDWKGPHYMGEITTKHEGTVGSHGSYKLQT